MDDKTKAAPHGSGAQAEVESAGSPSTGEPTSLRARSAGTSMRPDHGDDSREWEVTQGPGWETTGTDTLRAGSPEEREREKAEHVRLTGGGALDDEMMEPEPPELVESGPARRDPTE